MAALVVINVSRASLEGGSELRLEIFPGSATPTVFPADTPFWIGYAFTAEPTGAAGRLDESTRFELDVDGAPAVTTSAVELDAGEAARKTDVASFAAGLPAGWHDFVGRWFEGGRLLLSNRVSVEFVEG